MMLHGGNIYNFPDAFKKELIDFSANISPLGIPECVKRAMIDEMDLALHYPDPVCGRLLNEIAGQCGISKDWLICGNGAADVIYRLVYSRRPKKALVMAPTFVEYEEALQCVDAEVSAYFLDRLDFKVKPDILEMMDETMDMMFICNPNNPTGVLTDRSLLLRILQKAKECGIFLVIDECFLDFTGREDILSLIDFIKENRHLLILKSFTKMYAIPGVRLGYGICADEAVIQKMQKAGQSWSVSTLAQSAGIGALKAQDYKKQVIEYVDREREFLENELTALGIAFIHGNANYILIYCPERPDLYSALLNEKIMIRTCDNYKNLDRGYYRIAINSHEDNTALIDALKKVITEYSL